MCTSVKKNRDPAEQLVPVFVTSFAGIVVSVPNDRRHKKYVNRLRRVHLQAYQGTGWLNNANNK